MFQTFRHRDAHRVGQPCFLKPGQSQPPLDYTQPPWQAGIVAGGSKVMAKVIDDWNLTRELPGDGTMPHHASNIHDLIKGHAPAVLNYRRGIYEWNPTKLLKKQVNLVAITYCSWPSSCHEEAPSEPWWLKRMQTEPPRSEKHSHFHICRVHHQRRRISQRTAACLFWMVSLTVILRPFQSPVALAMSSPTFFGDCRENKVWLY